MGDIMKRLEPDVDFSPVICDWAKVQIRESQLYSGFAVILHSQLSSERTFENFYLWMLTCYPWMGQRKNSQKSPPQSFSVINLVVWI